jgi:hypothetical protein
VKEAKSKSKCKGGKDRGIEREYLSTLLGCQARLPDIHSFSV